MESAPSCSVTVVAVVNESSSDCCDALGVSFSKGGAGRRSHCIATSVYLGILVSVATIK